MKKDTLNMTVENFPDRRTAPDRSQQVLTLLGELSDRLRKAETERDVLTREILNLRESLQDIDDRNSQTQKALLAFENKFDSTENTLDSAIRRVGGMEEAVDKQSTEMLAILRKIEERFEAYDREYKNHAASIEQYADTLDRFDKRLEKLTQDKGRISRKLDAMEFQLADTEERLLNRNGTVLVRDITEGASGETETSYRSTPAPGIQVWTPESAKPQFMHGPNDIPRPRFTRAAWDKWSPQVWQYLSVGLLVVLLATLVFGVIYALLRHPGVPATPKVETKIETPAPATSTLLETPESKTLTSGGKALPDGPLFSKSVRTAMDQQSAVARKQEDDAAAAQMALADKSPLARRIGRDTALPRAIQAIESKALEGNVDAQHDMGALYSSGQSDMPVDYARAATWFRAAAERGNANARYNLGVLYQQGLGVEKDIEQAIAWYRTAALLGHPEARYNLGIAYIEGIGVSYNPAMAAQYFEQAARDGVIESAYNLGMILENGLIDEPRPFEALFWYKLAADGGSTDGRSALMRLSAFQKIDANETQRLFDQMVDERPELKQLIESRRARSVMTETNAPRVRVHTPDAGSTNTTTQKPDSSPAVSARQIRVPPPTPPKPTSATATANSAQSTVDGQMLARLQMMLADEGLYTGTSDGLMGPATTDAIRRYQEKYNMPIDGKPSTNLIAQMLARRLSTTAEPAAGQKTDSSTPQMRQFRINN